ncbi:Z1 domain-containing protein [Micromonospora sp. NBC_01699]|uniref:Z1 domain-containing protein n=1 Tax=Micromonospora sp. NBC_01699 TaxID=2975984 RepID=UPI002E2DC3C9|nr:Z1 domain-containing protein [Micromonospora sp. NBC_01699]
MKAVACDRQGLGGGVASCIGSHLVDALQMGRWFGFRPGYRDLVRLYVTDELREAFEAVCRDEEFFREELHQYARLIDGRPQVTPAKIPPLVAQRLPWLKPTAANKMYNAELVERRSPGKPFEPRAYPTERSQRAYNVERFLPLVDAATIRTQLPGRSEHPDAVLVGQVPHRTLTAALSGLKWSDPANVAPDLRWVMSLTDHDVDGWVVLLPQQRTMDHDRMLNGRGPIAIATRSEVRPGYLNTVADSIHRQWAIDIAHGRHNELPRLRIRPKTGAIVLYPTTIANQVSGQTKHPIDARQVVMAFCLVAPSSAIKETQPLVTFRSHDSLHTEAAIIDRV